MSPHCSPTECLKIPCLGSSQAHFRTHFLTLPSLILTKSSTNDHTRAPPSHSGIAARYLFASKASSGAAGALKGPTGKWVKGGFSGKMDKREAAQILGLRETGLSKVRIKEAHRRMMIANHPDRGGAPYLASKINEAKDLLEKIAPR